MTRMDTDHAVDFEERSHPVREYQRITEADVALYVASGWQVAGGHYHSGGTELAVLVWRPVAEQAEGVRG